MRQADAYVRQTVTEVGFCHYMTAVSIYRDEVTITFEREFTNATAAEVVRTSLVDAVEYGVDKFGADFSMVLGSNGRPFVELLTFGRFIVDFADDLPEYEEGEMKDDN